MENVTLYKAPLRQLIGFRAGTLLGYSGLFLLAKYAPDLFVDTEETNPNGVEQWKRSLTGGLLITWGCITNVAWYTYTRRIPSQIVLNKSQLWVRQLAIPSLPKTIPITEILPTSRRLPKDNFLSLAAILEATTTRGHKVSLWLSENGTYNNKSWLLNLVDFAAKKKSAPSVKPPTTPTTTPTTSMPTTTTKHHKKATHKKNPVV